ETRVKAIEDIFDRLASLLAGMVLDRARRGLYASYILREEPVAYIRGRINVTESVVRHMRGSPHMTCAYEEHTTDLDENQILVWTLYRLAFLDIRREQVRRRASQAFRALAGSVEVTPKYPRDCIGRFYHRLNSDYRPMHALCRFFLECSGPDIEAG